MVGKTYLRYVVGPQGGAVVSSAALTVNAALVRPDYAPAADRARSFQQQQQRVGGGQRFSSSTSSVTASTATGCLFLPSLEAVRVVSVRSGALLHTLIPAELKMPVEVTALHVVPLEAPPRSFPSLTMSSAGGGGMGGKANGGRGSPAVANQSAAQGVSATSAGGGRAEVDENRSMAQSGWLLMVGYSNGSVAVFSCGPTNNYGKPVCRFYSLGHRVDTNVLALAVDSARSTVCSGGQDTDLTVWDLVSQEAVFRLRGHRGGVVGLQFVPKRQDSDVVVSAAADGLLKVWNLSLRQCVQTVVASDAQVTSMVMDSEGRRLLCGMRESYIKVYTIESEGSAPAGSTSDPQRRLLEGGAAATASATGGAAEDSSQLLRDHGTVPRKYHKPLTSISFASRGGGFVLACTSKTVEVFRVLTSEEVKKKVLRKKKRRRGATTTTTAAAAASGDGEAPDSGKGLAAKRKKVVDDEGNVVSDEEGDENDGNDDGEGEENVEEGEAGANGKLAAGSSSSSSSPAATAAEEYALLRVFFMPQKVRSACFVPPTATGSFAAEEAGSTLHIAVTYSDNSVQTYTTALTTSELEGAATWTLEDLKPKHSLDERGHHSDIRTLCFVDHDSVLLSLSKEKVLMWSLAVKKDLLETDHTDHHDFYDAKEANLARVDFKGTVHQVGSVALVDAVSMAAISSNLCCVGLMDGTVSLLDVAAGEILFTDPAQHGGGVKHVTKRADDSGFLTVGADRRLVLWTVGLLEEAKQQKQSQATLLLAQEVELTEAPLFASFSPDQRFLGVGLQNNNIQLFFADSLKPYLTLFGHKLPPTSLSFSTDGTLVASVGMDKALRFWGTDFGDCHRAIHAHDDYVTQVEFVQDTHQVFTVSMDGSVKHWDGDNWTMIQLFRQHQRGVWSVAVTANATCVASAGVDKCIRCFLRTEEIVFPQEEEERMAQEAMDEETAKRTAMQRLDSSADPNEVGLAGQQTATTAEAAERLMEALDIISVELQRQQNPDDTAPRHPLLTNCTEWEYLWSVIESIRPSELRHALSALTSVHVDALFDGMVKMVETGAVLNYETAAKIVLALVMPAPGQSPMNTLLRTSAVHGEGGSGARRLQFLRRAIAAGLDRSVGRMDYNVAGLQVVRHVLEETDKVRFFDLSKVQGHKKKYHSRALPDSKQ